MKEHLNDEKINAIIDVLDGWTGKLTWQLLIEKIEPIVGSYTRQALDRHLVIKDAFVNQKKRLKQARDPRAETHSDTEIVLMQKIERLEAENSRLKMENNNLLSQFVLWQYNAASKGMTQDQLNAPLPSIDRDRTPE